MSYDGRGGILDIRDRLALVENKEILIYTVTTTTNQAHLVPLNKVTTSGQLYLNGLLQNPAYYSVIGDDLVIPSDMGLLPDDVVYFVY